MKFSILISSAWAARECNGPKYAPLGCFDNNYPHPELMPQPIRTVAPFFKMSNMAYEGIELDWKDPPLHRFFDKQPIIVMTHGWQEKWGPLHWLNDAHDRFMDAEIEPVNFIGVDWSGGADTEDYEQAVADTQIVGRAIGYLFNELVKNGMDPLQMRCVGHGLGAHACGWAGKYARNFLPHWQLGRIDALDPAGPWFDDKPKDGRLHLDDARFVQVIHTNGGLYSDGEDTIGYRGISWPMGDSDYFPNGGSDQPQCYGCSYCISENHCSSEEAVWYYIDSISKSPCVFVACASLDDYQSGKCDRCRQSHCNVMGYPAVKPNPLVPSRYMSTYYGRTDPNVLHGRERYCKDSLVPIP